MYRFRVAILSALCGALVLAAPAAAETKVELKNVHLCCPACVAAVGKIVKGVEGATAVCNAKGKTVTITTPDAPTAQKVVDALATGGFHGQTDSKDVTVADDSGVAKGHVKSLTLTGAHNCCGQCCKTIKETVKKVEGVQADTAKPKQTTFEVTGDFDAAELVKALNAAGFHVKVKK